MGIFKKWLFENLGLFCKFCGREVEDDGSPTDKILHPAGMNGPTLEKHVAQYGLTRIHPVVCKECYEREFKRKYPNSKVNLPKPQDRTPMPDRKRSELTTTKVGPAD